ncbi:efflux RND transporter permease subunit [Alkaliphilus sp. MSJ-5]|uniref:Efflux RND transporter permease subunit n=1 Tax=Alkaliphilus flagellatus TaxID=2841507 RepID=A0ABS6G227_9FIRM|nr:efflux RND transporter permease subunit [Alkaliphilus flagellatus]MBU5676522.1 efflux RND transporter permease subunit [Alkaliphilus flagellatus]
MNLSSLAVKKPVTITMIVLIVVLLGVISLTRLPIDLFPKIEIPVAVVSTSYTGAGPQEIENLITKQIEGAIATVGNIDTVSSISSEGSSVVIAQFNNGTDMDFAALEIREKVDLIKGVLPDGATQPMVLKIDPNSTPIIQIAISTKGDLAGLQSLAEDTFSQRLERLDGVASVSVGGGFVNEIEVAVNQNSLASYGLSINQLSQLLSASNMNLPGGNVNKGEQKLAVRVVGEFNSLDEIKNMPITLATGDVIRLQDVATVKLNQKDISAISRTNGKDSINISVQKQSGKNTVQVADLINKEIENLRKDYPNVEIDVVLDSSTMIKDSIDTVVNNVLIGSVLAIVILYIFLKNIRTTLIIGTSIPISLIASFILLYFNGITLNMMTLGGLALAVGMLVDSAIVVLENIYRFRSEGYSRKEAAIKGASEVGMAITASTLTTIAVFLPIVFIDGMVGTIFKDFALTVTLSLGASLIVSLTFIPMLSSKILKVESEKTDVKKRKLEFIYKIFDNISNKMENIYKGILIKSLKRRKTTIFISIVIFVVSIASLVGVGMEFFPTTDEGTISINISMPVGTQTDKIDGIAHIVEEKLTTIKEINKVFTNISSGNVLMGGQAGSNSGSISVGLVKLNERNRSTDEVAEEIRNIVKDIPGAEISVQGTSSTAMMTSGSPISISIKGSELKVLEEISNDFKNIIESVEGTRETKTSFSEGVPEVEILINKERSATYGLTTAQVASAVRGAATGTTATRYKDNGEEIDVVLRSVGDVTESLSNFEQIDITTPTGINIPLSQVADISVIKSPVSISRENQEKVVTVNSQIVGRDLQSIVTDINKELQEYQLPEGYYYSMGGENKEMMEAFSQLLLALGLAVILIYMVMAAQFESLIHPFVIMFTIPLAFSGGALALFITGRAFGVTAFIGIIMLAGIVVNNGIVLIDYINILRNEGKERTEAITIAGPVRLRPILMTTLTTILGLIPLALGIGEGAELQAPMATVVIGGLVLSTVLTLIFVPVLYTIFDDMSNSFKSKVKKLKKSPSEA